jgi:5-methylcytosine-specific restriction endonuclease McrA
MSQSIIARYVTPWKYKREQEQKRLHALRQRDGDDCRRCRRPLRFDLPRGHDMGPKVEQIMPAESETEALDNLVLCHRRCNGEGADHTREVQERVRRKNEAVLFSKTRKRAGKAA